MVNFGKKNMPKINQLKGLLSIGSTDIIGGGISTVFWFYIALSIEPESYGEIFYYLGIAGIASAIVLFGTQHTITVYVAKKIQVQSTLYLISIIGAAISSFIIIIIFYRVDISLLIIGYVINSLAIGDLLGRKLFTGYAKYVLTQKILTLVLGLGFYFIFGVDGIIFALGLSYIGYFVRIYFGFRNSQINFTLLKPRLGFTINNYAMSIANISKNHIDKLIIPATLGFAILGNYALAMQFMAVILMLPNILFKYILPQDSTGQSNKKLKIYATIISIIIAISAAIIFPVLIPALFPKYIDAIDAIQIMSFSIIPATIASIFSSELLGMEKSRYLLIGRIIVFIVITAGMLILGPIFGVVGVALSYLIANSSEAIFLGISNQMVKKDQ